MSLRSSRADAYACRNVSCEKFNTHEAELLRGCRDIKVILKQSFVEFIYLSLVTVMAEGGLCLFRISQPVSPFLANPKSMTTLRKIWHEFEFEFVCQRSKVKVSPTV